MKMAEDRIWLFDATYDVKIVTLRENRLKETLELMRESFYTDEPPAKGVQLQQCPEAIKELENLTIETFQDGVSVVALKNDKIVGASFNKLQKVLSEPGKPGYFEEFRDKKCKTETAKEYVDCMIRMDSKKDVFAHYGVDRLLEVMFLVTARGHRGHGIGRHLVQASVEMARSHRLPVVSVIFTSRASQSIGAKLGWDQLATVPMHDHVFNGTPYSDFTGDDSTQILMAYKL